MKFIILLILLGSAIIYIDYTACNKQGSVAAKIGWAGHPECSE